MPRGRLRVVFVGLLDEVRSGELSRSSIDILRGLDRRVDLGDGIEPTVRSSRSLKSALVWKLPLKAPDLRLCVRLVFIRAQRLYPIRSKVAEENTRRLQLLSSEERIYYARDCGSICSQAIAPLSTSV